MKICVSIQVKEAGSAAQKVKQAWALADLVELRFDRLGKGEDFERLLGRLLRSKKGPILVTNRKKGEGGFFRGSEEERIELLGRAVMLGADIVDVELSSGKAAIKALSRRIADTAGRTKLLVSHHDLGGTPSDRALWEKMKECMRAGGDIVKIVTTAVTMEDNLRVLNLVHLAQSMRRPIVAFCMGDLGRISRLASPLLGGAFTFASLDRRDGTAPGQMSAGEMKQVLDLLKGQKK